MGMDCSIRAAPDADIAAVLERPERVTTLLYGTGPSSPHPNVQVIDLTPKGVVTALTPKWLKRVGHASRSIGRRVRPGETDPWQPTSDGDELDLDRSWQGIHFLLTGTAYEGEPPLDFIVRGGAEVADAEVGMGPPRVLRSDEVRAVADAIERVPPDELRKRFDPERMLEEGIYPDIWDRDPAEDDPLGYLLEHYAELRAFVRRAADRGDGLIVVI
jgi:Domain of unknown function (DUF1877)